MKQVLSVMLPCVVSLASAPSYGADVGMEATTQPARNELLAADDGADSAAAMAARHGNFNIKGISLQLGGFLASETVWRDHNTESDIATNYSKIPFHNSQGYNQPEFRGTERQSRFSLLVQGNESAETHLAGYYELDFLGSSPTANPNESNSFTPRTRNVYMTIDWNSIGVHLLAGQNWSLATMTTDGIAPRKEYIPLTIDAQYAVGFNWERQWQFRMVKDWDKTFWAAISVENSQTVGVAGTMAGGTGNNYQLPAGALYNPSSMSINSYPDVIAKFALESSFGHYEVYGVARDFQSEYGGPTAALQTKTENLWAGGVGGGAIIPVLPKVVDLSFSGLRGKGIGRYGTAGLADATYGANGSLKPLEATQFLAQIQVHASQLDGYLTYGQEMLTGSVGPNDSYGYGAGTAASDAGCNTLGGTCNPYLKSIAQGNLGFWWTFYKGDYGLTKFGMQYSHTNLVTFADKNGLAPTTSENMVFTSLRYYPF